MGVVVTDLLAGLDDGQREAVLAPSGPVCVLAGAGTGKTRTITHRIARLVATGAHPVSEVLAVTFTARAAGEMRVRLRALGVPGVQARTFHSAALRQLRYFWPKAIGGSLWPVLEHKVRVVAQAAKRAGAGTDTATLRDLAGEIEWAKATLIGPADYVTGVAAQRRDTPVAAELVARVYDGYEQLKRRAEQLDFDDLLLQTSAVLTDDEELAREFRARYRCFVVDEYQDVTPLQQQVLDAWLGGRDQLTVVGDVNQTIYSFAGATPRHLLGFERRYPHATVVRLRRDYRSTPQVVSLANRVVAGASGPTAKLALTLTAVLPNGPPARFDEHPDEPAEAGAVAAAAAALIAGGMPAAAIAVLYRINAQSEAYEQALAGAGVPYVVRGGERFFARAEVRAAMVAIRRAAAQAPAPDPEAGSALPVLPALVRGVLAPVGLTDEPPPAGALRDRWESLLAVVALAEELTDAVPAADLAAMAAELDQRAEAQHAPVVDGVTLASLHAAKGLEWDAVFLVGLTDGTLPIQHADTDEAIEEERRLFYVGITRARTRLSFSWALSRTENGRRSRKRSRFLTGLAPDAAPLTGRRAARCRRCGQPLTDPAQVKIGRCARCPSTADPDLVQALRDWRRSTCAAASVPAFVVFSDATLLAIAERRPTDDAGLLAIPGIGRSKLDAYGRDVIEIVSLTH